MMPYSYYLKISRVVDGDTVDVSLDLGFSILHKARVRLMGIDTPESRTRDKAQKVFGLASKQRLKDLLKMGTVRMECTKEKGKFGRILGTLYIEDPEGNVPEFCINDRLCEPCECPLPGWSPEGCSYHVHARPYFGGSKEGWS